MVSTETTLVGSAPNTVVVDRNKEQEKQEAWLLLELQKLRRQIEACEIRMMQRGCLVLDQGTAHDFSVRIKDLEVIVDAFLSVNIFQQTVW